MNRLVNHSRTGHDWTLRIAAAFWALALCVAIPAQSAVTGKIVGRVTDETSGETLPGVNIVIEETTLGAASAPDGRYFIINIPAGTYRIVASIIGYAPLAVEKVLVVPDQTTTIHISMRPAAIAGEEVVVTAVRPLVQPDQTSTVHVITAEDLELLPIRGYRAAATLQSGVVSYSGGNISVRGGRLSETAFYVDGFSQQDPLTGNATTAINNNAIEQVTLITGGFNAEYGRIMSGIVNTTTKRGGRRYHGSLEVVSDFLAESFNNTYSYGYKIFSATLGGPVLKGRDRVRFFLSGEGRLLDDRFPRATVQGQLPHNSLEGFNWQSKLSIRLKQAMELEISSFGSVSNDEIYIHSYKFNRTHMPRREDRNRSLNGKLKHQLNATSFYEVAANVFLTERTVGDGTHFDDLPSYGRANPGRRFDDDNLFFIADTTGNESSIWNSYLQRKSWYVGFQGSYTNQVNRHHQFKAGFDTQKHTLRRLQHLNPLNITEGNTNAYQAVDLYGVFVPKSDGGNGFARDLDAAAKRPFTAAFYLQDKMEFEGLIINAGLRFDHLNSGTKAFRIEDLPLGNDSRLDPEDLVGARTYGRFSPRLGIAFPVTAETKFHFHIGKFYQQPDLQNLYVSYEFAEFMITQSPFFFPFGNPNLKPEQTTAYEFGIAHQLNAFTAIRATTYYKSIRDLTQVRTVVRPGSQFSYSSFQNTDFGTVRGLDMSFEMRRVRNISATAAYSFSKATGTGSSPTSQRNIAFTSGETPKQTHPLDFDQRHSISLDVDMRYGAGEGGVFFGRRWLEHAGANILFQGGSGLPYTPTKVFNEVTLAAVTSEPIGPINSSRMPWTLRVDMKLNREFPMAHIRVNAYLWVLNLFNRKNALAVYRSTGQPNTTAFLVTREGQEILNAKDETQRAEFLQKFSEAENDPRNYDVPRMIRAGLLIKF